MQALFLFIVCQSSIHVLFIFLVNWLYLSSCPHMMLFWHCLNIVKGLFDLLMYFYVCVVSSVVFVFAVWCQSVLAGVCVCKVRRFVPVSGPLRSAASWVLFSCHPHKLTCHTDGSPYPRSPGRARNRPLALSHTLLTLSCQHAAFRNVIFHKLAIMMVQLVCFGYIIWCFITKNAHFSSWCSSSYQRTRKCLKSGPRSLFHPFAKGYVKFPAGHHLIQSYNENMSTYTVQM